jgi:hypothetical protein
MPLVSIKMTIPPPKIMLVQTQGTDIEKGCTKCHKFSTSQQDGPITSEFKTHLQFNVKDGVCKLLQDGGTYISEKNNG